MITRERTEELYKHFKNCGTVSTDSRAVAEGSIFFALRGASFDGNAFAKDALAKGAKLAVVDDESVAAADDRMFAVEETLEALQALAQMHRERLGLKIFAITGTNGKTTTKELAAAVLERKYEIYATKGNLNNHIGVPLTLLSMTEETELGIVEIGASAIGEIAILCRIARPDYGLITNIGLAHLEGFGGVEGVRKGKGELYDFLLASGGCALVREDDPALKSMAVEREGMDVVWYDSSFADGIKSRLTGDYNIYNIAAAVAIGRMFGVDGAEIRSAIAEYTPSNNRSQLYEGRYNRVVVDCYNANPSSMRASIQAFADSGNIVAVNADNAAERETMAFATPERILILGDMLELGEFTHDEHIRVVRQAAGSGASAIYFVGREFAKAVSEYFGDREPNGDTPTGGLEFAIGSMHKGKSRNLAIYVYPTAESLREDLEKQPLKGKTVLLKGSRGVGLERLLDLM